jgi:hypothetical protein
MLLVSLSAVLGFSTSVQADGKTIKVTPETGIQTALDKAEPGDVIVLAPGTYYENPIVRRGGEPGKPLTIRAQKPGTVAISGADQDLVKQPLTFEPFGDEKDGIYQARIARPVKWMMIDGRVQYRYPSVESMKQGEDVEGAFERRLYMPNAKPSGESVWLGGEGFFWQDGVLYVKHCPPVRQDGYDLHERDVTVPAAIQAPKDPNKCKVEILREAKLDINFEPFPADSTDPYKGSLLFSFGLAVKASHVTIEGIQFHMCGNVAILVCDPAMPKGATAETLKDAAFSGQLVNNLTVRDCQFAGTRLGLNAQHGVMLGKDLLVEHCEFACIPSYGENFSTFINTSCDNAILRHNLIASASTAFKLMVPLDEKPLRRMEVHHNQITSLDKSKCFDLKHSAALSLQIHDNVMLNQVRIRVQERQVLNPSFIGFGFHVFFPCHVKQLTPEIRNEVLYKRWLELRPSFARITHKWNLGEAHLAELVTTMKMMQKTDTRVYLTTWDPKATPPGAKREAYAKETIAMLADLRKQGCHNLSWYCLANELSVRGDIGNGVILKGWGAMRAHMDTFKDYHRLFHQELKERKLDIGLLAADESPNLGVEKARWARKHMDDITAVYGGHHYINDYSLDDLRFYDWFLTLSRSASAVAPDKPYIVGEFGAKQHRGRRYGFKKWGGCAYYDTDKEPMVAIQVAEAVLAQLNGGIDATAYWTLSDFPDDYTENKVFAVKWGTSRWSQGDHSTRDLHYGLALLTRYFRGPAKVLQSKSSDAKLRTAVVQQKSGAVSVVVVNRYPAKAPVGVELGLQLEKPLRKFVFNPAKPPQHPFGDLPPANALIKAQNGSFEDELPPNSFVVYTTDYEDRLPAEVKEVRVESKGGKRIARWAPATDTDHCYYRVFSGNEQVGSTVATSLALPKNAAGKITVKAVDTSGNVSR